MAAESEFTPWRLPGAMPESVTVSDETGRINAFVIGLSDDIIDIPGIGGHFALQVAASLQGEYRDQSIAIDGGTNIEAANTASIVEGANAAEGYGAALTTTVRPRGRLEYTPGVTLYPNVRLVVFGFTVINADLFTLHLDLPSVSAEVDFDEAAARLPLPDLHVDSQTLRVSDAGGDSEFTIENRGEKALLIDIADWPEELEPIALSVAIEPGSSHQVPLLVRAQYATSGLEQRRSITLHSNDPDADLTLVDIDISVARGGSDEESADRDPGLAALDEPAGCGCRSSGGSRGSALPFLLAFALLAWRRRRTQR